MARKSDARPCHLPYMEVLIDNVLHNYRRVKGIAGDAGIMAIVKDQAYGCGALPIAQALQREGVPFFAVARTSEAKALRKGRVHRPILVLGEASAEEIEWGAGNEITFALNRIESLGFWKKVGVTVKYHVNIDSGMTRMGVSPEAGAALIEKIKNEPQLRCEGVFTHFACADVPGTETVQKQYDRFSTFLTQLEHAGVCPTFVHVSNTAAAVRFGHMNHHLIRPGIGMYGCRPDPAQLFDIDLRTIVNLKAPVVRIEKVRAETAVSYGGTYTTPTETNIATLAIGYAHGVPRLLSNNGEVLLGGQRHPIVGNVTMDYIMVDLGPVSSVQVGDTAVVIGYQGGECITVDEVALRAQTIGYEILCGISTVIDRYIIEGGKTVHHYKHHPL